MNIFNFKSGQTTEKAPIQPIETNVVTFLLFCEYMGYISDFIEDIDKWVDGTAPKPFVQFFLGIEARAMLKQMKEDYTIEEIHMWWDEYYPLVLCKADEALKKMKVVK